MSYLQAMGDHGDNAKSAAVQRQGCMAVRNICARCPDLRPVSGVLTMHFCVSEVPATKATGICRRLSTFSDMLGHQRSIHRLPDAVSNHLSAFRNHGRCDQTHIALNCL